MSDFWTLVAALEASLDAAAKKADTLSALSSNFREDHRAVENILTPIQLKYFEPSNIGAHYEELKQVDYHLMDMLGTLGTIERDFTGEADLAKAMTALWGYLYDKLVDCYEILDRAAITVHETSAEAEIDMEIASNVGSSSVGDGAMELRWRTPVFWSHSQSLS